MATDLSPAPRDLDHHARKLYTKLRRHIKSEGRWKDSDREALGQACRFAMRARLARTALGSEMLADGYKGQPTEHPLMKIAVTNERLFFDALKELGLTPRARAALGQVPPTKGDDPLSQAFND